MNPLELFRRFVSDLRDLDSHDVDSDLIDRLIIEVQCAMDLYVAKVRTDEFVAPLPPDDDEEGAGD
jgi:hypothetical protein